MVFTGICLLLVVICGTQLLINGAVTKKDEYIPIKYPGPIQEVSFNRYGEVPIECANKTYCTIKPADYPQTLFNEMFKGTKPVSLPTLVIDDLAGAPNRQGDPDYLDNCDTSVTFEPLYKVRSKRGWHTVVQAPEENYVQMVRLETCSEQDGACFRDFPTAIEFKTYCRQKYSVWEFLVADENGGTEKVMTELPICCSCHYKSVI